MQYVEHVASVLVWGFEDSIQYTLQAVVFVKSVCMIFVVGCW